MQILAFLLMLLKIIGIVLLCILLVFTLILALILLIRIKYNIASEKSDKLYADIEATWFLKFVYFRFRISDKEKKVIFKVLWKYLYKDKQTFKTNTEQKPEKSEEYPKVERSTPKTNSEKKDNNKLEFEEQKEPSLKERTKIVNEEKELSPKEKTEIVNEEIKKLAKDEEKKLEEELEKDIKEYSVIDKIKRVWDYPDRKEIQDLILKLIKRLFKVFIPEQLNLDIEIGLEDPSITGYVLAISSILVLYFGNNINVRGNFHQEVFNGKLKVKGYFTLGQIIWALLRFTLAKPIRKMIWKYLKTKLLKNKKG